MLGQAGERVQRALAVLWGRFGGSSPGWERCLVIPSVRGSLALQQPLPRGLWWLQEPREAVAASFLEMFQARLEQPEQWEVSLPMGVGLDGVLVPSQPNYSMFWGGPFSLPSMLLQ